jgi:hypothetical protein
MILRRERRLEQTLQGTVRIDGHIIKLNYLILPHH